MNLISDNIILNPRKALNKAFLKVKPNRSEIEKFKANLIHLLDQINEKETEEFHKNLIADFLKNTYYNPDHFVNTKGRNDLVIHNGKDAKSTVGVLIEAKSPTNRAEMLKENNINTKAFQELVLYYLRERITHKNLEIKHLVVTNIYEWFIFDVASFEKHFAQNKPLVKQFTDFEEGRLSGSKTDFFYKEIAGPLIETVAAEIQFTHFDLKEYNKPLRNKDKQDDTKLIALFKLLSPEHLLKLPFTNDSNSLDKRFYSELLHIIGLTETKEGSKKLIERKKVGERNSGSLLENSIKQLDSLDKISRLEKPSQYGDNHQERLFNVGLELVITWVNRILFLKLLEAQLISYHKGDKSYAFLSRTRIRDFDDLNSLFFQVLARKVEDRDEEVIKRFGKVPYLNSSLFEPTELEHLTLFVSNLDDRGMLPTLSNTVLKDLTGTKKTGEISTLEYLFDFLDAYDFAGEGSEEIQEDNKTLINASVLGLIFEKINGYKDGSFFTPGFITMYMCRETIRRAVVQKFNEAKGWKCETIEDLYDKIEDRSEANTIINSLKICDPAVGSGHFLVSALNEIIAIKNDLKVLQDRQGKRLKEYHVEVVNDELVVTDEDGNLFEYNPANKESQRIQETLFHEKQTIIENCLFGVDINPNSVKICRLRLWIELLKNAYYKNELVLETLPNIDINIKCGNSLISRFALDADLKQALKKSKWNVEMYRTAVKTYRNAESKEQKREMERLIETIKGDFRSEINKNDPKILKLYKLKGELVTLTTQTGLFELGKKEKAVWNKKVSALTAETDKLEAAVEEIKNNKIYENAFEWRFEFPEVLNDEGDFVGFDVVIGNPPYIRQEEIKDQKGFLQGNYKTYSGTADLYVFFVEKGFDVLKATGQFTYIMPNKWMQTGYGKPLRNFLLNHSLTQITDFGDLQVFDEATTYPCIIHLRKAPSINSFVVANVETLKHQLQFADYVNDISFESPQNKLTEDTWVLSGSEHLQLLEKLQSKFSFLESYVGGNSYRGVLTGLTEAFVIDEETRERIIKEDPFSAEIIKPVLRGRDIKPWFATSDGVWLISTFPNLNLDIENYPGIKNHLMSFGKERLEQSGNNGSRKKTSNKWFETQDSIAYWSEFLKPKIMYQKFQVKPCFIYDEQGLYCNDSMWIMPTDDKVLLGILNSKIGWYLTTKYCTAIQNGCQLIWKYFSQIPIAKGSEDQREILIEKVTQILSIKKTDPIADTSDLEKEIDQLVYELYELTEEEIKLVEGGE
ncbi:type II restriction endonuclease [Solitalea longa]|uniref:site-specific DNA-methyltransferase (adenine-specific) n=1 Tax=Solitalea longa TaxID=2079460 RepID=A0A2S5A2A7_9SPHI|nr:Eco57I restriction-modification methylase domain-containing protein [Solitalea longa]POY36439.1 type II restriction endonuclease [Solitalea longa]